MNCYFGFPEAFLTFPAQKNVTSSKKKSSGMILYVFAFGDIRERIVYLWVQSFQVSLLTSNSMISTPFEKN